MFKNISLRYKLLGGFLFILAIFIGFSFYLLATLTTLSASLGQLNKQSAKLTLFLKLDTQSKQLSDAVKSYILTKDPAWQRTYDKTASDLTNILTLLQASTTNTQEADDIKQYETISNKIKGTELLILAKTREGKTDEAIKLFDVYYTNNQKQAAGIVDRVSAGESNQFLTTGANTNNLLRTIQTILLIVVFSIILITLGIAFFFTSFIISSLKRLDVAAEKIAKGDLQARVPITSRDEIGKFALAFNDMTAKLQESYGTMEQKIQEKTAEALSKVKALEESKEAMQDVLNDLQVERDKVSQAKAKDDAILSSIGEGMIFADLAGRIVFINTVAEDILDLSQEDVLGKTVFEAFPLQDEHGDSLEQHMGALSQTLYQKVRLNKVVAFIRKDNQKVLLSLTTTPVLKENILLGAIEIIRDITKEKEIDRMKTEFISLASHQLRTPLSAIKWFTEMLLGGDAGPLNSEQNDFAKNISDSTQRMIELVNSLLNISRIESGRIVIDPKPTNLKDLVQEVVNDLQAKIAEKKHNLIISVKDDLPKINLDPRLIRQVYMNLLTNAIKYTPKEGEITVFISKKDDSIISQITDNGYGIPQSEQGKLFQKFFRAANIIKVETDGTGLGLYLIKAIIESSQGKLWFVSKEGQGTTFWFSLPLSGMVAKKGEVTLDE